MKASEKKKLADARRAKRWARKSARIEAEIEAKRLQDDAESWRRYMNRPKEPTLRDRLQPHLELIARAVPQYQPHKGGVRCVLALPDGPVVAGVSSLPKKSDTPPLGMFVGSDPHLLERGAYLAAVHSAVFQLESGWNRNGCGEAAVQGRPMSDADRYEWRAVDGAAKQEVRQWDNAKEPGHR